MVSRLFFLPLTPLAEISEAVAAGPKISMLLCHGTVFLAQDGCLSSSHQIDFLLFVRKDAVRKRHAKKWTEIEHLLIVQIT